MRARVRWQIAAAVVLTAAAAVIASRTLRDEFPMRVWHRWHTTDPPVVSDRPGGEPLAGTWGGEVSWKADNVVALQRRDPPGRPSWICDLLDRFRSGNRTVHHVYRGQGIRIDCAGDYWTLFTRADQFPGEGLTDDERCLVGRWRHSERRPVVSEIELELRADRRGQGSDGSSWRWLSAEGHLQLKEEGVANWRFHVAVLDPDRLGYREPLGYGEVHSQVSGTRIGDVAVPR